MRVLKNSELLKEVEVVNKIHISHVVKPNSYSINIIIQSFRHEVVAAYI